MWASLVCLLLADITVALVRCKNIFAHRKTWLFSQRWPLVLRPFIIPSVESQISNVPLETVHNTRDHNSSRIPPPKQTSQQLLSRINDAYFQLLYKNTMFHVVFGDFSTMSRVVKEQMPQHAPVLVSSSSRLTPPACSDLETCGGPHCTRSQRRKCILSPHGTSPKWLLSPLCACVCLSGPISCLRSIRGRPLPK